MVHHVPYFVHIIKGNVEAARDNRIPTSILLSFPSVARRAYRTQSNLLVVLSVVAGARTGKRGMLTTKEAIKIGRLGGNARTRNLSPEKRSEIARWAWHAREQKKRGQVTQADRRCRLIESVRTEDQDLAELLNFLSWLPTTRAEEIYQTVPYEQRQLVERKLGEVLCV